MIGPEFDELVKYLKKLPGITQKTAENISLYLINESEENIQKLISSIKEVNLLFQKCFYCNSITKNNSCTICIDTKREKVLMVVESNNDLNKMEKLDIYFGKYFILDIPKKITISEIKKNKIFSKLVNYAANFDELIFALSPTIEGEIITNFLIKMLQIYEDLKITQLAQGIPIGAQIEYIDPITLKQSYENRKKKI